MRPTNDFSNTELELVWGARAVGRELSVSTRQAFYLLESGRLPAKKVGRQWCTSRKALRQYFADISGEAVTPASDLISVSEACDRSGEKPATIINWVIRHKIGSHVKTGSGGDWMVDPEALEQLLEDRAAAI